VGNSGCGTPTPSSGCSRPSQYRPGLSSPSAIRLAPSAWATTPPAGDRAIRSWRRRSPHQAITRGGIEQLEGRALGMTQRAANEPSFELARDLLVGAPRPDQEIPVRGCPLPTAQHRDLGVDEAGKVCDHQSELPAAETVQWRARPTWIDRGRSATQAVRPGYASPSVRALAGVPPGEGRPRGSPSQPALTDRRPKPEATAHSPKRDATSCGYCKSFAEIRLCGASHTSSRTWWMFLL
jgi:hypothetical protein